MEGWREQPGQLAAAALAPLHATLSAQFDALALAWLHGDVPGTEHLLQLTVATFPNLNLLSLLQKRNNYTSPEAAEERLRNPSPQRRKLLHTLLADQRVQQQKWQQETAAAQQQQGEQGPASEAAGD